MLLLDLPRLIHRLMTFHAQLEPAKFGEELTHSGRGRCGDGLRPGGQVKTDQNRSKLLLSQKTISENVGAMTLARDFGAVIHLASFSALMFMPRSSRVSPLAARNSDFNAPVSYFFPGLLLEWPAHRNGMRSDEM